MNPRCTATALFVLIMTGCGREPDELLAQSRDAAAQDSGVSVRRVWTLRHGADFRFDGFSPSPDGRYLTEIDDETEDLAVRDLKTGEIHHLTDKGPWEESQDYAVGAAFSPDGKQVAYGWYVAALDDYELRVLDFHVDAAGTPRGSNPRTLVPNLEYLELYGWSPDHEVLAAIWRPDRTTALVLVSAETGETRVIESLAWESPNGAALSEDGRFLAYDLQRGEDPSVRDIHLVTDLVRESVLLEGPGRNRVVGWVPGSGDLLFASNRTGSPCLWRLPMADGRASGDPVLVREDVWRLVPVGFSRDNLYFGVLVEQPAYRTAAVDVEEGLLTPLSTVFEDPHGAQVLRLDWSPDGEHVVYKVDRPGRIGIVVRSVTGEVLEEFRFDMSITRKWADLRWAPDGGSVVFHAFAPLGKLFRLDLESGELTILRRFQEDGVSMQGAFALSPDGRTVTYCRGTLPDDWASEPAPTSGSERRGRVVFEIVSLDLATGSERSLYRLKNPATAIESSPDGTWLAFAASEEDLERFPMMRVLPAAGGEARVLYAGGEDVSFRGIAGWTRDGRWILFTTRSRSGSGPAELWRVSPAGGDPEKVAEIQDFVGGARLNPDGRTLTYRAGERRAEIWVMEGLTGTSK